MTSEVISFAGKEWRVLFPAELRPLTSEERARLRASLLKHGCQHPITIWNDGIVDGINRLSLAAELHLPPEQVPMHAVQVESIEQARELCRELNEARRHLSPEEKLRMIQERLAAGEMSQRQIAKEVGVSRNTVRREAASCSTGSSEPVEHGPPKKVLGADGKKRPARKPPSEEVRERIRRARELRDCGVKLEAIAAELGVSKATASAYLKETCTKRRSIRPTNKQLAAEGKEIIRKLKEEKARLADEEASRDETTKAERDYLREGLKELRRTALHFSKNKTIAGLLAAITRAAKINNILLEDE